jgi:peptide/nickel transport system substrate-binding protein
MLILAGWFHVVSYANPAQKPTGELRIGVPTLHTETFHPLWATNLRKFYYEVMFDYLVNLDKDSNLVEGIAYKWEEAPNHLSWTFWIRDGVKFHDGTPLTLDDVKYSLDALLGQRNVAGVTQREYQERVEIVPPNKIVIYLKRPWPIMLYMLSPAGQGGGVILPKKYVEEKGDSFEVRPIGTGPYKFLEKREGDFIKFEAQDHHWRVGIPRYKYVTFKKIPEEGTRIASLKNKETDVIVVSRAKTKELESENITIIRKIGAAELNLDFLRTYETDNPLNKQKVRQALVYAIDKADILKHVLGGEGKTIGHCYYMFSNSIGYKEYPVTPYDPKKAKQLLTEAGYTGGFTMHLYSYATIVPEQKLVCEAIASYWEAIGVKVKILEMESSAFFTIWTKRKEPPGPAAFVHSWTTRVQATWRPMFSSDIKKNTFSQTVDPELDRLIDEFDSQATIEGYIRTTRKCEERVLEMFYKSGIVNTNILFAASKDVPKWDCGKGNVDSYRFEYIGAVK